MEFGETGPEFALKDLQGTYIGISPTDESACGLGEIEVTIDEQSVRTRWATGWGIEEDEILHHEFRECTPEEVAGMVGREDAEGPAPDARIFSFHEDNMHLVFFNDLDDSMQRMVVVGSMGDLLAPTVLFGPEAVAANAHETAFDAIEEEFGRKALPRLSNGGLAPTA